MEPLIPLPIRLPARGKRNLASTLHAQLRRHILDGRLRAGVRLPSTRALAAAYGISRNTALAAFDMLLSEGYVSARRGSGTTIARSLVPRGRPAARVGLGKAGARLNRNWIPRPRPQGEA